MGYTDSNHKSGFTIEVIAAVVLAILAIGSFAVQALLLGPHTTQRETVLFGALQFLLTIGFGWFSTRAISRAEFERNLKQFAIGAYRRIADIEGIVERLRANLRNAQSDPHADPRIELQVANAVLDDAVSIVRSSSADWADVIGEEILALEAIAKLRREKSEITPAEPRDQSDAREAIEKKIADLTERLPANLRAVSQAADVETYAQRHQQEWVRETHHDQGGLRIKVVAGGIYRCDGDPKALVQRTRLFADLSGSERGVQVSDADGIVLGNALNMTPLSYSEFRELLAATYGTRHLPLEFTRHLGDREELQWFEVRVTKTPPRSSGKHQGHAISNGSAVREDAPSVGT